MSFHVVLVEPEIPQNTGNIARTCAATGCTLHLVRPLGFSVTDKYLKRSGLDYWKDVEVIYHQNLEAFLEECGNQRLWLSTTKGGVAPDQAQIKDGDWLVFGKETAGLPETLLKTRLSSCIRLPMKDEQRSLNLSNAVCALVYEAFRQNNWAGLQTKGYLA